VPAGWVQNLDDYWKWLESELSSSGGSLNEDLVVQMIESPFDPRVLLIEQQRLTFPDGQYLDFTLAVTGDLNALDYNFHFADANDRLIWRYDKHIGHEAEFGTDTHLHVGHEDHREAAGVVEMDQVLKLIRTELGYEP